MIWRLTTMLILSALIGLAHQLSKRTPTTQRHERLMRHLRPTATPTRHTHAALSAIRESLERDLALVLVDQSPAKYLATITANAVVLSATLLTAATLIKPSLDNLLVTMSLVVVFIGVQYLVLHRAAEARSLALRDDFPLLLSELGAALERGNSLTSAMINAPSSTQTAWLPYLKPASSALTRGEPLANVLKELAHLSTYAEMRRALELLSLVTNHQVTQQLISQLLAKAQQEHHHRLLALAGKREQLIWIPVALATLIPGVLLVLVPLIGSLKLLSLR